MNVKIASYHMIKVINKAKLPREPDDCSKEHLYAMCDKIINEEVIDQKAHRWLGYIQGCCCSFGIPLAKLKEINHIS